MMDEQYQLPSWQGSPLDWDIDGLESEIMASPSFQSLEYDSPICIALRGLHGAFLSGKKRWEWFARSICTERHNITARSRKEMQVYELAGMLLRVQQFDNVSFYELDDNDLTDERSLYAFFSGLDSDLATPDPHRHLSLIEQVQAAVASQYPEQIVRAVQKLPESLIHAVTVMEYAGRGLFWLYRASYLTKSLPLPGIGSETMQDCREIALLYLADARVAVNKMRMAEVLERAQLGRRLPENAAVTLFDELGIQLRAKENANRTKEKKSDAAKKRDANGVDIGLVIAAVESGTLQKTVALEYGISEARVSQIMTAHRSKQS